MGHQIRQAISKSEIFDYIIIGSGFGGSVSALRLAEKGYRVLVLGKGKRYESKDFPHTNWNLRKNLWIPHLGLYEIWVLSLLRHVFILHGTGVGGGSLNYCNQLHMPSDDVFEKKEWRDGNWKSRLAPFYKVARGMSPHIGGQELPMHDSRLDQGFAISYQCEPTPRRHTISSNAYTTLLAVDKNFPGAALMVRNVTGRQSKNVQRYIAGSFYMQLVNCSGLCLFGALTSSLPVAEYLNALTGWDLSNDEYLKIGERILNLRKAFNVREGVKIEQCKLPDRALGLPPLSKGPLKGITVDIDRLQKEFFETLGWNPLTGGPTKEKIDELGIKMSAAKCED